jgi:hypothetical protein
MSFYSLNEQRRYLEEKKQTQKDWSLKLKMEIWASAHPQEWKWIHRTNLNNKFSQSLLRRIKEKGDLTPNQLAKIREIIEKEDAK